MTLGPRRRQDRCPPRWRLRSLLNHYPMLPVGQESPKSFRQAAGRRPVKPRRPSSALPASTTTPRPSASTSRACAQPIWPRAAIGTATPAHSSTPWRPVVAGSAQPSAKALPARGHFFGPLLKPFGGQDRRQQIRRKGDRPEDLGDGDPMCALVNDGDRITGPDLPGDDNAQVGARHRCSRERPPPAAFGEPATECATRHWRDRQRLPAF